MSNTTNPSSPSTLAQETAVDTYDAHIIPAETAARKEREGDDYKHLPEASGNADSLDTQSGFTVDKEGLLNNYAIEPEMYYEVPGDLQDPEDLQETDDAQA